jgi:hypothetical protein
METAQERTRKEESSQQDAPPRFHAGKSIYGFSRSKIDEYNTLLGNRFLCRGGGIILVAPSGMGKSTFTMQASILWSCGKSAFDISPSKPLRILIVQSEDDDGDCIEMSEMIDHLGLTDAEKQLVDANTVVIRCNDLTSGKFIEALSVRLSESKFDLLIINPYSSYLGEDVVDTEANIRFLHIGLNPLLAETGCNLGALIVCHTPKTKMVDFSTMNPWDFQYLSAGAAAITNWARGMIVIVPQKCDQKLFKFVAAKRWQKIGWGESERYFTHSDGKVSVWKFASKEQIKQAEKDQSAKIKATELPWQEVIEKILSPIDPIDIDQWMVKAKAPPFRIGQNRARTILNAGVAEGIVTIVTIPRHNSRPQSLYKKASKSNNGDHL